MMSNRDKTLQDKFKDLFKRRGTLPGNQRSRNEYILTEETLKDLRKESTLATRLKTMKEVSENISKRKTDPESNIIEKLWHAVADLFSPENNLETRHAAFTFLHSLVKALKSENKIMRAQFFRFIKNHQNSEDVAQRLELLKTLTSNGKTILYFEEEVGPFLLDWFGYITEAGKMQDYLSMIDNVIRFNASYLDDQVISGFIDHICVLCCTGNNEVILTCLQIMATIVAYSNMSPVSLPKFIGALCRTVTHEHYCQDSWKIMKNLLGTHMGHSALYTMCRILQEPALSSDPNLLRGAVFYISMALWGTQALQNLYCPPSSVLPSFLQAVQSNHITVSYEVILGIQTLVEKYGTDLMDPSWNIILQIISLIHKQVEGYPKTVPYVDTLKLLNETLNNMEKLVDSGQYYGTVRQFYNVIEECSSTRPESSVMKLIDYLAQSIIPIEHLWLSNLHNLLQKYFKMEIRTNIRLKVLDVLSNVIKLNRLQYEDELLDRIVIPLTANISHDPDVKVKSNVAKLLVELCLVSDNKKTIELLENLNKMLLSPFEANAEVLPESELADINTVVLGLIRIFNNKINKLPCATAVKIYQMLSHFLELHYNKPKVCEKLHFVRQTIFDCFLKIRINETHHVGCIGQDGKAKFSPFLCANFLYEKGNLGSPPPQSPANIQQPMCTVSYISCFINCLKIEKDWDVLNLVLQGLTKALQNKSLILSHHGNNELNSLVDVLCSMISDKSQNLLEYLKVKVNRDFYYAVLRVLINLASYHSFLDYNHQIRMIESLLSQIQNAPKTSAHLISALSVCILEMREVMVKHLPKVLLDLSKISATVYIAVPVLEFLSTLATLPMLYANLVFDQYMAVFALALPYANPFKYNHYTVSLAHHVISVWFLKCRQPFRKNFVQFITATHLMPFKDLNQDSSERKRSSSLTEQGARKRNVRVEKPSNYLTLESDNKNSLLFYEELTEVFLDLTARHTYSTCSAIPKRSPTAEFLLSGGQSMSWLIGNKLVTITTSGCSQKVLKHGLCDKCLSLCSATRKKSRSSSNETDSLLVTRQNSNEKSSNSASSPSEESKKLPEKQETATLQQLLSSENKTDKHFCSCWCQGWAEIYIRKPTGDMSCAIRIQNQLGDQASMYDFPLNEISKLYMPFDTDQLISKQSSNESVGSEDRKDSLSVNLETSRQSSRDSNDAEDVEYYDEGGKSRNPVRRSNSSPEMSANWKLPFHHGKVPDEEGAGEEEGGKKGKMYSKDMRVSCEAIPEEIAGMGTTPPSNEPIHPTLLSYHSYPGDSKKPPLVVEPSKRPANLPNLNLQPLAGKPPQSPTQTSPRLARHSEIQKSSSSGIIERNANLSLARERARERKNSGSMDRMNIDPNQNQNHPRDRGHTISVMSPATAKPRSENLRPSTKPITPKSGISPSFVFLQLYHDSYFGNSNERPLLVNSSEMVQRAVKVLDSIPPYEIHKIGVLYIGEGQCNNEVEILRNKFGSLRYVDFLQNLGSLIKLQDVDPQMYFLGGLENTGGDGKFTYIWEDDVIRVVFHVATMMPNKESDPNCNNKKSHIGNNYVNIIYNESGEEFNMSTIKGQFNFASIIIEPLDHNTNRVVVKVKDELKDIFTVAEPRIVSDHSVAILARQMALHANLASLVARSLKSGSSPYASNWLERLRKIKNVRNKILQEHKKTEPEGYPSDVSLSFSEKKLTENFIAYT